MATSLNTYWDKQIPNRIRFEFPLDFDRNFPLQATYENHVSAKEYVDHIDQYIQGELKYGPFKSLPFQFMSCSL